MGYFYDQFYKSFPAYLRLHQKIFNILSRSSRDSKWILDAGCGTGLLSVELARRGYPVVGIDKSPVMLDRAWKKKEKENLENLVFLSRDLNDKIYMPGFSFQRIILVHSLYLMEEPQVTLKNLSSLLPPGGEMIMCNPSRRITKAELFSGGVSFFSEASRRKGKQSIFYLIGIALAMGVLNLLIQRRKTKIYHCWDESQIQDLLRPCGLRVKLLEKSCIAESHLFLWAEKGK
jgi:2-polyprenyl-3-methyl-5-hydroxy-6-metoxy-1,4-benzoquinol methylase